MNCESVRELMSAYYDRELDPDREITVRKHLEGCVECEQRLTQFLELSQLTTKLRLPEVPADLWSVIDSSLDAPAVGRARLPHLAPRYRSMAIAAILLLGASAAFLIFWARSRIDEHQEMAVVFGQYLERFREDPGQAQEILLARYQGRLVQPRQPIAAAKITPQAPEELPGGFARVATYALSMPCCTCMQTIYRAPSGETLALFEHVDPQRSWFGDRPTIMAQCHGKPTCLVQLQDRLAACWKSGENHLTVVGARNLEQVSELMGYLDGLAQSRKAANSPGRSGRTPPAVYLAVAEFDDCADFAAQAPVAALADRR